VNEILSKHTGKTLKKVEQDTDRDNFLNAKEAVTYGIIDEILEKRPEINGK
jgi:ATP-dependent Clp protease protease subunit